LTISVGSDHAGFLYRQALAQRIEASGHSVTHFGAMSTDAYDYPDAADLVCQEVLAGRAVFGILVCGSGIGVSIRANRHQGIRAALCTSVEMAKLARAHNYANVLCLGARITELTLGHEIVCAFLEGREDHALRHEIRVAKLDGNAEDQ